MTYLRGIGEGREMDELSASDNFTILLTAPPPVIGKSSEASVRMAYYYLKHTYLGIKLRKSQSRRSDPVVQTTENGEHQRTPPWVRWRGGDFRKSCYLIMDQNRSIATGSGP